MLASGVVQQLLEPCKSYTGNHSQPADASDRDPDDHCLGQYAMRSENEEEEIRHSERECSRVRRSSPHAAALGPGADDVLTLGFSFAGTPLLSVDRKQRLHFKAFNLHIFKARFLVRKSQGSSEGRRKGKTAAVATSFLCAGAAPNCSHRSLSARARRSDVTAPPVQKPPCSHLLSFSFAPHILTDHHCYFERPPDSNKDT